MSSDRLPGNPEQTDPEDSPSYFSPLTIGFAALSLLVMIGLVLGFAGLLSQVGSPTVSSRPTRVLPPAPRLQADPKTDFQELKATQMARLNAYEWIDREAGVVRIPIDRAMELIANRGILVTPTIPGPTGTPSPTETANFVQQRINSPVVYLKFLGGE